MMSAEEFFESVKKMRFAQMRHNMTGKNEDFLTKRKLEREVDSALLEWQQRRFLKDLTNN